MPKITYKDLYSQVVEEIRKENKFVTFDKFNQQLSRSGIAPLAFGGGGGSLPDISVGQVVSAIQSVLEAALPPAILSGLEVTATSPASNYINISAGTGSVGGKLYTLASDVSMAVPFDSFTTVYFINLYQDRLMIEATKSDEKLTIAKINIPNPDLTSKVFDHSSDADLAAGDGYIQTFIPFKFYGINDKLEEDSIQILKNNIGDILAETIVGNLTISENLKVTNVTGTLEMDSKQILIKDTSGNISAKFNKDGTFYYDNIGREVAKFSRNNARIGNILVTNNTLQSSNFVTGSTGFQIKDTGDVEFNGLTVRGTIYATAGLIGGFTIESDKLYGGTIQTAETVEAGATGVVMDADGLRGYDSVLGNTFNLPTDGSAPTFSSGIINSTIFEIQTNAVIRTSETVGDGTSSSAGILINNTGLYGCEANQLLSNANLKALINGSVSLKGSIISSQGSIGGVTITSTKLSGGLIEGSTIRGATIETSEDVPKIRMDDTGLYYQTTTSVGKYGGTGSGDLGFQWGDGSMYGAGVSAYLFNTSFPVFSVVAEQTLADMRLYNRGTVPSGAGAVGDFALVNGVLRLCITAGTPGTYTSILMSDGTTGGTGSAGAGNQYVEIEVNGTVYKVLHDGIA